MPIEQVIAKIKKLGDDYPKVSSNAHSNQTAAKILSSINVPENISSELKKEKLFCAVIAAFNDVQKSSNLFDSVRKAMLEDDSLKDTVASIPANSTIDGLVLGLFQAVREMQKERGIEHSVEMKF